MGLGIGVRLESGLRVGTLLTSPAKKRRAPSSGLPGSGSGARRAARWAALEPTRSKE